MNTMLMVLDSTSHTKWPKLQHGRVFHKVGQRRTEVDLGAGEEADVTISNGFIIELKQGKDSDPRRKRAEGAIESADRKLQEESVGRQQKLFLCNIAEGNSSCGECFLNV
eukprot:TRINITY_DN28195_c0_g1_i1.p1 TRINITY_DN28195_c0_g1~~TRINITY_DN28195_c0_g1_i1.p1  ORF type:complete len:110 (-),score=9.00 TRINITY_DN28195_c0_g1_i1:26-355(-)